MAMEYLGLSDINGPLVALDGVSGVGFEEMVRIQTAAGPRAGRVVALEGSRAVIQVFAGTSGMDLSHASTRFSGHPMRLALADEIVGRIFNGAVSRWMASALFTPKNLQISTAAPSTL